MPVRDIQRQRPIDRNRLVDQLVDEWQRPRDDHSEPLILREYGRGGALTHVYVVWSRWSTMDQAERGEIILDAAERVIGAQKVLEITIAMGLTPDEAQRMGIQ